MQMLNAISIDGNFPINLFVFQGVQAQITVELYLKSYFRDFLM